MQDPSLNHLPGGPVSGIPAFLIPNSATVYTPPPIRRRPCDPTAARTDEIRPITIEPDFIRYPEGSVLYRAGDTVVLCNASVLDRTAPFLRGSGEGWVTAEYAMLPRATDTRSDREVTRGKPSGRSQEIQRLIGRSLRAAVNRGELGERTLAIDCDVLQADGSTRTASISGGWIALVLALGRMYEQGLLSEWPRHQSDRRSRGRSDRRRGPGRSRLRRGLRLRRRPQPGLHR